MDEGGATNTRGHAESTFQKLKVFISYARADLTFADAIVNALETREIEVAIDRRDLPYGEEWMGELLDFIRGADTVIFIVSPRSIASKWCTWEAEQVRALSKRLVPIELESVPAETLPAAIGNIHMLPFTHAWHMEQGANSPEFGRQCDMLALILNTDRAWAKEHTRLGDRARVWEASGRRESHLLRGNDIPEGERWATSTPRTGAAPTELHLAFIRASRDLDEAERAAREKQVLKLRKTTGRAYVKPASQAVAAGRHEHACRLVTAGALSAEDIDFSLVPELWKVATRALFEKRTQAVLRGHGAGVYSAVFSPDGSRIVTASHDSTARVWDAEKGTEILLLKAHASPVVSASFSPDGRRIVTASHDATARIWDAGSGNEIAPLRGHTLPVNSAAFSPDGRRIVTASLDSTVRIWDAESAKEICRLNAQGDFALRASFNPDGRRIVAALQSALIGLSGGDLNTAVIWDLHSQEMIQCMKGHERAVRCAQYSPDGRRIVTASEDKSARIWEATTGKEVGALRGHEASINSALFSSDGDQIVTASDDGTVRIWDAGSGEEIVCLKEEGDVGSAAFSPDGRRIVTACADAAARIWDAACRRCSALLTGYGGAVTSVSFDHDGKRVLTGSYDGARILDADDGKLLIRIKPNSDDYIGRVRSAWFSPDAHHIVLLSADGSARIHDICNLREIACLEGNIGHVSSAAFSPDGRRIVTTSSDGKPQMWDAKSGEALIVLDARGSLVSTTSFSPDGKRVLAGSAGDLLAGSGSNLIIWNSQNGEEVALVKNQGGDVRSAFFSKDGRRILTVSIDGAARVLDAENGNELALLRHDRGAVVNAAFSREGRRIVTASTDRTVRVWDGESGVELACLEGHTDVVLDVMFSPDGRSIISGSEDYTGRLWDVSYTEALVQERSIVLAAALARGVGCRTDRERHDLLMQDAPDDMFSELIARLGDRGGEVQGVAVAPRASLHTSCYLSPTRFAEKFDWFTPTQFAKTLDEPTKRVRAEPQAPPETAGGLTTPKPSTTCGSSDRRHRQRYAQPLIWFVILLAILALAILTIASNFSISEFAHQIWRPMAP